MPSKRPRKEDGEGDVRMWSMEAERSQCGNMCTIPCNMSDVYREGCINIKYICLFSHPFIYVRSKFGYPQKALIRISACH